MGWDGGNLKIFIFLDSWKPSDDLALDLDPHPGTGSNLALASGTYLGIWHWQLAHSGILCWHPASNWSSQGLRNGDFLFPWLASHNWWFFHKQLAIAALEDRNETQFRLVVHTYYVFGLNAPLLTLNPCLRVAQWFIKPFYFMVDTFRRLFYEPEFDDHHHRQE